MVDVGGVSIDITARTADAQAGIRGVQNQLDSLDGDALDAAASLEETRRETTDLATSSVSLSAALRGVSSSTSRAEDNIEEMGDAATTTATQMAALSGSTSAASVSIAGFNTTLTAGTVVALFSTAAALSAVATAGLGLVGVLGAVGGAFAVLGLAGVIGNLGELKTAFVDVLPEIKAAFEPLSDIFGPVLIETVRMLPDLAEDITEQIQAAIGSGEQFQNTLRAIRNVAFELIPQVVGGMFEIAEAALPTINSILDSLGGRGQDIFETIRDTFVELRPELTAFAVAFADFIPDFIEFGTTVADTVLPPLTALISVADDALETFNSLPEAVQKALVIGGTAAFIGSKIPGVGGGGGGIAGGPSGTITQLLGLGAIKAGKIGARLGARLVSGLSSAIAGSLGGQILAGLALGGLGVGLLQKLGVMDAVNNLGKGLRNAIGGGVSDALLALATPAAAPIAAFGGFINGFVGNVMEDGIIGGVKAGIKEAKAVLDTFFASIRRTLKNLGLIGGEDQSPQFGGQTGEGKETPQSLEMFSQNPTGTNQPPQNTIIVERVEASGREEGRRAANELKKEMQTLNITNTSNAATLDR